MTSANFVKKRQQQSLIFPGRYVLFTIKSSLQFLLHTFICLGLESHDIAPTTNRNGTPFSSAVIWPSARKKGLNSFLA